MKKICLITLSAITSLCFMLASFTAIPLKTTRADAGNVTDNAQELPLDSLVDNGGLTSIFNTVSVIGDSFSSGTLEDCQSVGTFTQEVKDYSWGQFLARTTGVTVHNLSRGGMTAKEYCTSFADTYGYWNASYASDAYYIALGYNDLFVYSHELGIVSTDVKLDDYNQNTQTYAGYVGQIISKYKTLNQNAVFFLVSMPVEENDLYRAKLKTEHCAVLYDLANAFENTFVIDLNQYAPRYDQAFKENYFVGGHLSTAGYSLTAKLISSYTDYIIRHNTDAFRTLGFTIPEDYEHTVSPVSYNFDEQALTAVDNQWGFNDQTSTGVYVWDQSITFMPSDTREVAIRFTAPDDGVISPDGNGVIGYAGSIHDYASVESDGMRYAVYLNEQRVVPSNGLWGKILFNGGVTATPLYLAQSLNVKKGDTLTLVIENGGHGNTSYDSATALLGFFWSDSTVSNMWFDTTSNKWTDDASGSQTIAGTTYLKKDVVSFLSTNIKRDSIFPTLNDGSELPLTAKITDGGFAEIIRSISIKADGSTPTWIEEYSNITKTSVSVYDANAKPSQAYFIDGSVAKDDASLFIQTVKGANPDGRFFLIAQNEEQKTAFGQLSDSAEKIYLIDLYTYGTADTATDIAEYVDYIIRQNMGEFKTFGIPVVRTPVDIVENQDKHFEVNTLDFSKPSYTNTELWNVADEEMAYIAPQWNSLCPSKNYALAIGFTAPVDGSVYPTSGSVGLGAVSINNNGQGDGARFAIYLNATKIFPADSDWMQISSTDANIPCNALNMKAGDTLYFVVDNGGNGNNDSDNVGLSMGFFWLDAVNNTSLTWFDSSVKYGGWTDKTSGEELNSLGYRKDQTISYHYVTIGNNYGITYELNGGEETLNPTVYSDVTPTFTLNNPTRTGYEFIGWTSSDVDTPTTTLTIEQGSTGGKTFTANWEALNYTITYELNGGTDGNNPATYNIESEDITFESPTKVGYNFIEWQIDGVTATGIEQGSTGNVTVAAVWQVIIYTITYELDGGTNGNNPVTYTIESNDIVFENPTKDGYTFIGWQIDGVTSTGVEQGSTGNVTVTAVWEKIPEKGCSSSVAGDIIVSLIAMLGVSIFILKKKHD